MVFQYTLMYSMNSMLRSVQFGSFSLVNIYVYQQLIERASAAGPVRAGPGHKQDATTQEVMCNLHLSSRIYTLVL